MSKKYTLHSKEDKDVALSRLRKKELELKREFLTKSTGYQTVCNEIVGKPGWIGSSVEINTWILLQGLKKFLLFIFTCGGSAIYSLYSKNRKKSATVLKELKELKIKREAIERAQQYFQEIEDDEESYQERNSRGLDPWVEKLVASSLTVLPQSRYEELIEKKKDPYLKFLHLYACVISFLLTGGLIVFYILYRKSQDSDYKFLDSSISKHVVEKTTFSNYLKDLMDKEQNFDSLEKLSYSYSRPCEDLTFKSHLSTKLFKNDYSRVAVFVLLTLITGGFFIPLILSKPITWTKNREKFYKWWEDRKTREGKIIKPLGNIAWSWWTKEVNIFRKIWTDLYLSTFFSEITNNAIATTFFKPKLNSKKINWALFWMFTSPLGKWIINLILLLLTYTFVLIWDFSYNFSFDLNTWPLFAFAASGTLFLILSGYHIYLIS